MRCAALSLVGGIFNDGFRHYSHANPAIEVSHVCTRFGDAVVHEDVNLTIMPGEIFAIAGGNGSGKSTLLREIIGLHAQAEGTIRLFGQDVAGLGEQGAQNMYRRLGVMFQQGALFSSLTLAENVAVPLKEHTDIPRNSFATLWP